MTRFLFLFRRIDTKNGNVYLIESPDRELTPTLTVMIRVEVTGRKGKSSYTVHPIAHDIGNIDNRYYSCTVLQHVPVNNLVAFL